MPFHDKLKHPIFTTELPHTDIDQILTKPSEKRGRFVTARDAQGRCFPLLEHVYQGFLEEADKGAY
jgi:hypothetical protein